MLSRRPYLTIQGRDQSPAQARSLLDQRSLEAPTLLVGLERNDSQLDAAVKTLLGSGRTR